MRTSTAAWQQAEQMAMSSKGVLLQNTPGNITITDGQNRRIKTSDDRELILEKSTDNQRITYEGYRFANATEPTTVTESGVTSTWGGRSKAGNTTTENAITVASGTHTNIYGGWTTDSGSTAAADKQTNSTANKVKVNGSANVTGTIYGGFTNVVRTAAARSATSASTSSANSRRKTVSGSKVPCAADAPRATISSTAQATPTTTARTPITAFTSA